MLSYPPEEASIIACESARQFTNKLIENFNIQFSQNVKARLVKTEEVWFANKEVKTIIHESIRQRGVFIVQLLQDPLSERSINDNFIALLTAIDAARQADASDINVIIPQFPYARQERRKGREGITAKLAARFLEEAGAVRVFSFDLHAEAVVGFFDVARLDNLRASEVIIPAVEALYPKNDFVVVSPDAGGAERGTYYAKYFGNEVAIMYKTRNYSKANTIDNIKLIGEVKGKDVVMVDDMIDSAGTIVKAAMTLKEEGARGIILTCTFPFFSGLAIKRLDEAYKEGIIQNVIGTDAVFHGPNFSKEYSWYTEVSITNRLAMVIFRILNKESINI